MNRAVRLGSLEQLGQSVPQASIRANYERWKSLGVGKTAVVTGANAGLGFFASLGLVASWSACDSGLS